MRIFKIKKGGETENVEEAIIVLNRAIDDELLKKAVNLCAEKSYNVADTVNYIQEQFDCVEFTAFSDLDTLYC